MGTVEDRGRMMILTNLVRRPNLQDLIFSGNYEKVYKHSFSAMKELS